MVAAGAVMALAVVAVAVKEAPMGVEGKARDETAKEGGEDPARVMGEAEMAGLARVVARRVTVKGEVNSDGVALEQEGQEVLVVQVANAAAGAQVAWVVLEGWAAASLGAVEATEGRNLHNLLRSRMLPLRSRDRHITHRQHLGMSMKPTK